MEKQNKYVLRSEENIIWIICGDLFPLRKLSLTIRIEFCILKQILI
jgi:hypothetical protein